MLRDEIYLFTSRVAKPKGSAIKTNSIFRLLRNFSLDLGLVKNVRVVVIFYRDD
jgi:hypothetical protein